jgi:predicted deacetylase
MKPAQYLVRFDDICATMDWSIWERVESMLSALGIRPILAVVPNNRDPKLEVMPARDDFWDRVRDWQRRGWTIAMHGFEHRYQTAESGLVGINAYSEFAGLPREAQRHKLEAALQVFALQGVAIDTWVAPAHSFDATTAELLRELGVLVISDGFYRKPVQRLRLTWVPQQLWRFRVMPAGVWTVCYHANGFEASDLARIEQDFTCYRDHIVALADVLSQPIAAEQWMDRAFHWTWRHALRLKRTMAS